MPEIALAGCGIRPLSSYLKALGILRLLAEQKDPDVRGCWENGIFHLHTSLDADELCRFFAEEYSPTPLVTPWNGGSGFYPGDNKAGINAIVNSSIDRLRDYRSAIGIITRWSEFKEIYAATGKKQKELGESVKKDLKQTILQRCRSVLPERCLPWLDAAYALREDRPAFPPLLGTGGNEGRFEYANNFMQQICTALLETDAENAFAWVRSSLFGMPSKGFPLSKMAQFDPGSAGGVNQGYKAKVEDTRGNPWDYILMLEGTMLFAASLARRSPNDLLQASAPFCVTSATSAGFSSSDLSGNNRGEIWLPVWSKPAGYRELKRLFNEGRATLARRQVRDGSEFARSTASLGVDRGIDTFERYSFLERRGQSYVAMPCGTISTEYRPMASLLSSVFDYVNALSRKDNLPASVSSRLQTLRQRAFACVQSPDTEHFIAVSRAIADIDRLPGISKLTDGNYPPAPPCRLPSKWMATCDDGSVEVRIAAALASIKRNGDLGPLRANIAPVKPTATYAWDDSSAQYIGASGDFRKTLGKILRRRIIDGERFGCCPWTASIHLNPSDIAPLLFGTVDYGLLDDMTRSFSLMESIPSMPGGWNSPLEATRLPYAVAFLKILHTDWGMPVYEGLLTSKLTGETRIPALLASDRLEEAGRIAAQRIRTAGGTNFYLPNSYAEMAKGLNCEDVAACMLVPIDIATLFREHLRLQ